MRNWFTVVNWQLVENKIRTVVQSKRVSHHPESLEPVPWHMYSPKHELTKKYLSNEKNFP